MGYGEDGKARFAPTDQGVPQVAAETGQDMVKASTAAKKLGVHPRTVKRAIVSRQIPGTRIGTLYLVNAAWLAEVTSWMPQQEAVA